MIVEESQKVPSVRIKLEAKWRKGLNPEGVIESSLYFITSPESVDPNGEDEDNRKRVDAGNLRESIQFIYIPAIRDPETQLRNAAGTFLWRLFNTVDWTDEFKVEIEKSSGTLNNSFHGQSGMKTINTALNTAWKDLYGGKKYGNAKISFASKNLEALLKKVEVEFFPNEEGSSFDVSKLGDGIRSLFYLSLVNTILDIENQTRENNPNLSKNFYAPSFTLLAVEEPENHVSPHLLGKILDGIDKLSNKNSAQVITTSHSSSTIKRVPPERIRHFRLDESTETTQVCQILLPDKADEANKYVREAIEAFPEIYFSKLVVLGEGDTEMIVLPKIIEISSGKTDSVGISVTPLGGKHVNHFWKLLSDLKIPHVTILDIDTERFGGGWGRIKYVITQLIKNGAKFEQFKNYDDSPFSQNLLDTFSTKELPETQAEFEFWKTELEKFGVFFSDPIDMDFMLLSAYETFYKANVSDGVGPRIPDKLSDEITYKEKLTNAIKATLKTNGGDGAIYSETEKALMIWYQYLFLNRGKPATHISVLSQISDEELIQKMPAVLTRLLTTIKSKLETK